MDINKFRKKLKRYQEGQSNETESALIEAWYKSYPVDEQQPDEKEAQILREHIHNKIKAATSKTPLIYLPVFRIAASLAIISTISLLIWKYISSKKAESPSYYTVTTGTKGIKQVTLPDSSVIWLNADSRLKVPLAFKGHFREVYLDEGEAFFEIKRNYRHPFIVHSTDVNVQVLGTSFNVRSYKNLESTEVAVATGKVGVTKNGRTLAMLLPGQELNYNHDSGKYYQKIVNPDRAQSWKQGYTYLKDVDFKELSLVIKNIFGLSLKAGNSQVDAYHFSLRVDHHIPADQLLKVISQIHNTQFRKEGNNIIPY
jgi:ferric-dicitrate binding protein FerR (iron transport regulator)